MLANDHSTFQVDEISYGNFLRPFISGVRDSLTIKVHNLQFNMLISAFVSNEERSTFKCFSANVSVQIVPFDLPHFVMGFRPHNSRHHYHLTVLITTGHHAIHYEGQE